ncbi:type IV toxin-antitoxin system AbiEi family antitoxin domain-containing protein [Tsukamurella hominis]|uniref:type IV toxin-antitoxin system AbiEi family antitoxin domain-containing protein n=1 Tax=Tsukamurella hominis TaxID=1970232 RepID=UPI0039EA1AC9
MGELLTRKYLLATGRNSAEISRAVDRGELIRLAKGVYALGADYSAPELYRMRVQAVGMSCSGVISHESAAVLFDVPYLRPERKDVHVTVDRVHGGGRRPGIHVHPRPLVAGEIVEFDGMRVTSRVRTSIDVAMTGDLIRGVAAIDAVRCVPRFPKPTDPSPVPRAALTECLDRLGRRRGSAVARRALGLSVDCSGSPGESWSRVLIHSWGLPAPRLQTPFDFGGRQVFADFEWGSLIGEFDGKGKYGTTDAERAAALEAEKDRHALFVGAGFEVVRWDWDDLLNDALLRAKLTPTLARHGLLSA